MSARLNAGAFRLAALAASASSAEQLRLAAERPDGVCPAGPASKVLGIARLGAALPPGADAAQCVLLVSLAGLSDAQIDEAVGRIASVRSATGIILSLPGASDPERASYAIKRLSSIFRSGSPEGRVALYEEQPFAPETEQELAPYVDALALRPGMAAPEDLAQRVWALAPSGDGSAADAVLKALAALPRATMVAVLAEGKPLS